MVISSVTFSPEPEDDGTFLKCLGDNPKLPGFSQEDSFKLNVVCKYPFISSEKNDYRAVINTAWRHNQFRRHRNLASSFKIPMARQVSTLTPASSPCWCSANVPPWKYESVPPVFTTSKFQEAFSQQSTHIYIKRVSRFFITSAATTIFILLRMRGIVFWVYNNLPPDRYLFKSSWGKFHLCQQEFKLANGWRGENKHLQGEELCMPEWRFFSQQNPKNETTKWHQIWISTRAQICTYKLESCYDFNYWVWTPIFRNEHN